MAGCDRVTTLKIFEVILCTVCLLYKWWTDEEASRLFFYLEKRSREWPLLNNITWNQPGSWFADVTYGGYVIITIGLLVAHVIGELRHTRKTECFLLGIGAFLFFGVGCMVITSFDNVPDSLIDNAIILGILSILTGFIFLIDIGCCKRRDRSNKVDRQEKEFRMKRDTAAAAATHNQRPQLTMHATTSPSPAEKVKQNGSKSATTTDEIQNRIISELQSSIEKKKDTRGAGAAVDEIDAPMQHRIEKEFVQTKAYPQTNEIWRQQNRHYRRENGGEDYDKTIAASYSDNSDDEIKRLDAKDGLRKSRGSQTSRKHFEKMIVTERNTTSSSTSHTTLTETTSSKRDGITSIDSPIISRYKTQSPTVSTSNTTQKLNNNSTASEETYKLYPAKTVIMTSKPTSPQDPGYVLHTASKWPNMTHSTPKPYEKTVHQRVTSAVPSAV